MIPIKLSSSERGSHRAGISKRVLGPSECEIHADAEGPPDDEENERGYLARAPFDQRTRNEESTEDRGADRPVLEIQWNRYTDENEWTEKAKSEQ